MKRIFVGIAICLMSIGNIAQAQSVPDTNRVITTVVPFLNFAPDARIGALGNAGAALSADANAAFFNPARLVHLKEHYGGAVSYTPWLRNLVDDMFIANISGYHKVGKGQVVALTLSYFNNGEIDLRDDRGGSNGKFHANEFMLGGTYSRQLSQNFSMGVTLKYINSNLAGNAVISGQSAQAARTVAGDISALYRKEFGDPETGKSFIWSLGGVLSNIGGKIGYGGDQTYFLPTNIKLGTGVSISNDGLSRFNFLLDLNKLMVPTNPIYRRDANGDWIIEQGRDPKDLSLFSSMFGSFGDAPGGFSEEIKEINLNLGAEYWYREMFALRAGYSAQSQMKGNSKFFTAGVGAKLQDRYGLDFAYLIPTTKDNPLANTIRITLSVNLNKKASEVDDE